MKRTQLIIGFFVSLLLLIASCMKNETLSKRTPNLPANMYDYAAAATVVIPQGNPWGGFGGNSTNTPVGNPTTNAGATLGRVLFYERLFSLNNSISCGSCHKQQYAFADNQSFSNGYDGKKTLRNAVPVFNENMNAFFFWDGRINTLEAQTLMPTANHIEMGMENLSDLPNKLKSATYYPALFKAAFGTTDITDQRIAMALAQFMRSMTSTNSKFDVGGTSGFVNFTAQETQGMQLFSTFKCNNCHGGNNLNTGNFNVGFGSDGGTNDWANTGLDINSPDKGRMDFTNNPKDNGVFKVPSLRNVALTAPYMHDGRYSTLDEVIEHYNSGIQPNSNLDFRLTQGGWGISNTTAPVQMNMTSDQKQALKSFLLTFTDYQFIADPKFADPFN